MEEGYYTLSADGGGSKLIVTVFDDDFHFRAAGYGGPVNGCFSIEEKRRQIEEALSECLAEVPPGRIRRAFLAAPWMGKQEDLAENDIFFQEVKKNTLPMFSAVL